MSNPLCADDLLKVEGRESVIAEVLRISNASHLYEMRRCIVTHPNHVNIEVDPRGIDPRFADVKVIRGPQIVRLGVQITISPMMELSGGDISPVAIARFFPLVAVEDVAPAFPAGVAPVASAVYILKPGADIASFEGLERVKADIVAAMKAGIVAEDAATQAESGAITEEVRTATDAELTNA